MLRPAFAAVGEFVACGTDANPLPFFRRLDEGWDQVGADNRGPSPSWPVVVDIARERAGRDPMRLVVVPPVTLPWMSVEGFAQVEVGHRVVVDVPDRRDSGSRTVMMAGTARARAAALLMAADRAEKA